MPDERQSAVPLTQEQILAQLQTRGFESGFQATPLRDFWGALTSITGEMRSGQRGAFAVSLYNFEEIEVIQSIEPYTSPVAQLEIPISKAAKSKMGYWGDSVDDLINPGVDKSVPQNTPGIKGQGYLIGKRLHVVLTPGHPIPHRDDSTGKWEDRPQDCWVLLEIQGESTPTQIPTSDVAKPAVDAAALALGLLNGKTLQQWHQGVFSNPSVKKDTKLINLIISGQFISGLEGAGKVTKDVNGVYTVV